MKALTPHSQPRVQAGTATPRSVSPRELRALLIRRRWLILALFVLGWGATVSLRWVLPPRYESSALLLAVNQSVPAQYVAPNVNFDPDQLLQSMGARVLSRARLQDIVSRFGLFPAALQRHGMDAAVKKLRADISLQPASVAGLPTPQQGQWSAIQISVRASSADLAQRIANSVTTDFVQDDLSQTQQASDRTTSFLRQQLAQAQQDVSAAEQKVRDYEQRHLGELPGQQQSNLAMSLNLQTELDGALDALDRDQRTIATAQAQLANAPSPTVVQLRDQLTSLQAQLVQLRSAGDTARHPDVVSTEAQIAAVRRALASAGAQAAPGGGEASAATAALRGQLQAAQKAEPKLQAQVATLRRQLKAYRQRLADAPLPASALTQLNNQLQQAQAAYQALLAKTNASAMASALEQSQGGAQFELVNPPDLPRQPAWPNLALLCWLGLAVGLGLGVGAVALAEIYRGTVAGEADLARLGLGPVIVHIPPLYTRAQRARRRLRHGLEWLVACTLLAAVAVGNLWLLRGH